ncbi:MAG: D-alanine--D-alanine ligase [Saprospiraceae bacterium]|nr:D-alanine--D-alanine ligase [Saprospiraceae bacterium]
MDRNKLKIGILFGGKSAEHEISIQSAKNIMEALDPSKYDVVLIHIDKNGRWQSIPDRQRLDEVKTGMSISTPENSTQVVLPPQSSGNMFPVGNNMANEKIDVIFPILHGPFGEDGTVQGLLKLADLPFVGPGVLGSAVGMDKDIMKRLLRDAAIPIGDYLAFRKTDPFPEFETIAEKLGLPLFVKPANLGSSVGISRVQTKDEFEKALQLAYSFDRKIVIEANIIGREIECGVLGNEKPIASIPGEIIPSHAFYSYEAKYLDEKGAQIEIPARISEEQTQKIQELAIRVFEVLECEGLSRVDFFLTDQGDIFVNEINTMPGFTAISMYPKMWEYSGISYANLIDRLIQLAIDRFQQEKLLVSNYPSSS